MKLNLIAFSLLAGTALFFTACQKESTGGSHLKIRMTDAPTALEEVNVDLRQVNLKFESDSVEWVSMQTKTGIYNLLDFQNGMDTLIAQGSYPTGTLKEIRLVLGDDNTVKENGQVYPLTIPSGSESGLKIKLNEVLDDSTTLLLDFDAALSVKKEPNGYKLRPVVKLK